jgi:hypothetical protein
MKRTFLISLGLSTLSCMTAAQGQSGPAATAAPSMQGSQPVSYASVTQLNGLLAQLEASSKTTQADLVKLRIEHWKTSTASKKETLEKVDSIQRNLQGALPEVIAQLRAAPEDLPTTFKLYRNLDALCDVVGSVTEDTGAFGARDELIVVDDNEPPKKPAVKKKPAAKPGTTTPSPTKPAAGQTTAPAAQPPPAAKPQ